MKCFYEVLDVERSATTDDIKKAHRKLALKWHPDKNKGNEEEAHRVYQIIQEAYDCLSDPQEKAFYDKHREQILRGGSDHQTDEINVMGFFSSSCYSGFEDETGGFYVVYNDLFRQLAEDDLRYVDGGEWEDPPEFGNSTTQFEEVREFYGWWQSYYTKRNYMWLDELYDVRQADGRRVLRAMEKENKKIVDEAKREYNESVRTLVSHIKKKDPRCIAQREKQRVLEEERLEAEKRRKEDQRRKRVEEIERLAELEKDNIAQHDEQLDELLNEYSDSDEEEDPFYCPLCKKLFKSDKMMKQHEKSKKHIEKLVELQEEFSTELEAAGLAKPAEDEKEVAPVQPTPTKKKKKKKNKRQQNNEDDDADEDDMYALPDAGNNLPDDNTSEVEEALNNCKIKPQEEAQNEEIIQTEAAVKCTNQASSEEESVEKTTASVGPPRPADDASEEAWREYMGHYYTQEETTYCGVPVLTRPPPGDCREGVTIPEEECTVINTVKPTDSNIDQGPKSAACNMCQASFHSKTKLFEHLKETGHAIKKEYAPKSNSNNNSNKSGVNKKNKKGRRR